MELMNSGLRIFVSSTYEDLKDTRRKVIRFLQEVIQPVVISMETFGSDESKPKEHVLAQVDTCNLFVGIYAGKYGSIDPETGLSMTELEYRKACDMLAGGRLLGLLCHMISPDAKLTYRHFDNEPLKVERLNVLKADIARDHTVDFFDDLEDVPLNVLRDVIRKLRFAPGSVFRTTSPRVIREAAKLDRPLGMAFYSEEHRPFFGGRDEEMAALLDQVLRHPMSLLVGESGIGKTSLMRAGLIPRLMELGWRCVVCRPMDAPAENLRDCVWKEFMKGLPPAGFGLADAVRVVADELAPGRALVVIDQFEDVLEAGSDSLRCLARELAFIQSARLTGIAVLIAYRGDVESRIGRILQEVSGCAQGLPRLYLGPLSVSGCNSAIAAELRALGTPVPATKIRAWGDSLQAVARDLFDTSVLDGYTGVYPPYVQMVIAQTFSESASTSALTRRPFTSARKVVSDYLMNQLRLLGRYENDAQRVLVALASSAGRRRQKSADDIRCEVGLRPNRVRSLIRELTNLRMIRFVDGRYEIAHDFLARSIVEALPEDDREAKRFKEFLSAAAATHEQTGSFLTVSEHLRIYRHRARFVCGDQEFRVLLMSHLAGSGPVGYWLRSVPMPRVLSWVAGWRTHPDEAIRRSACLFMVAHGIQVPLSEIAELLPGFEHQNELSDYISQHARQDEIPTVIKILAHSRLAKVIDACTDVLSQFLTPDKHEAVLAELAFSRGRNCGAAFGVISRGLAQGVSLAEARKFLQEGRDWRRLLAVHILSVKGERKDLQTLASLPLGSGVRAAFSAAVTRAIPRLAARLGDMETLNRWIFQSNEAMRDIALEALDGPVRGLDAKKVLRSFVSPRRADDPTVFLFHSAQPAAEAVRWIARRGDRAAIRLAIKKLGVTPEAGELIRGLARLGNHEDFLFVLDVFRRNTGEVQLRDASGIFDEIASLALPQDRPLLSALVQSTEFWSPRSTHVQRPVLLKRPPEDFDGEVAYLGTLQYARRLVAYAFAKVADKRQFPLLMRLLGHEYWSVRHLAAGALARLGTADDLDVLTDFAMSFKGKPDGLVRTACLLDEKAYGPRKASGSR
jgi:hypothetical protein